MLAQERRPLGEVMWFDLPAGVPAQFRARLTSTLRIAAAGHYELSLASAGRSRLMLDGEELIENWEHQRPGGYYGGPGYYAPRRHHYRY